MTDSTLVFTDHEPGTSQPETLSARITRELTNPEDFGNFVTRTGNTEVKSFSRIPMPVAVQEKTVAVRRNMNLARVTREDDEKIPRSEVIGPLLREGDEFQEGKRDWVLRWRWDKTAQQLLLRGPIAERKGSNIPVAMSAKNTNELRDILWHRQNFEGLQAQMRQDGIAIDPEAIVSRWEQRIGISGEMKKDLPQFLSLYWLVAFKGEQALESVSKYFKDYYSRISLKRTVEGDSVPRDPVNWQVACAIAIAGGMPEQQAFTLYSIKPGDGSKPNPQEEVRTMSQSLTESRDTNAPLSPVYEKNARIVGRMLVHGYMIQREQALMESYPDAVVRTKRILAETVMMMALTVCPEDDEMRKVEELSDVKLFSYVDAMLQRPLTSEQRPKSETVKAV